MTKKITLSLCCIFISIYLYSQDSSRNSITISGIIIEKTTNQPLEYATIILKNLKTNKISGGITNEKGLFSFIIEKGTYNISVEYISFKSVQLKNQVLSESKTLKTIILEENSASLNEIIIIAEKTTVDIRLDKKIYNIGKDLSVRGGNASDVLGNVPSVQVDVEGAVSLRGNDNVTILIDGRPSALVGINGADALRQLPADAIEKVEIITSPSARYDAEGTAGIINIILRKSKLTGFNGSLQADIGNPDRFGLAFNANLRTKKWNFFTNTGWRYRATPGNSFTDSEFFSSNAQNSRVVERRIFGRLGRSLFTSFGSEYYINNNSSIIANVIFNKGNDDDVNTNIIDRFDAFGSLNEATLRTETESEDEERIQYTLDYINNFDYSGKKLSINAQYSTDLEDILNNITEFDTQVNVLNDLERVLENQNEKRGLLQIDYVFPIGENIQYEVGYRGNYRDIFNSFFLSERQDFENNGPLEPDTGLNNSFNYKEFINAAYFQYGQEFGKISLLAGLRFESTSIEIKQATLASVDTKSYQNFFPTINIGYKFKDGENMTIGYNKRIRRPRGWFLNPFPSRSSESNIFSGNLDLNPVISDAFDIVYLKKWKRFTLSTSIYYNRSSDNWEFIQQDTGALTDNGDPVIRRSPINLSVQETTGLEFTLNYKPFKFWNVNSDFNLFHVTTDGDFTDPMTLVSQNFDFENTAYSIRLNQKISLPKKLEVQVNMNYRGPNRNAQSIRKGIFTTNIAVSKDIFKEKASLSLNISDLFNSRKRQQTTTVADVFEQYSEFQWRQRQISLNFTYRFNQKKKKENEGGGKNSRGEEFDG